MWNDSVPTAPLRKYVNILSLIENGLKYESVGTSVESLSRRVALRARLVESISRGSIAQSSVYHCLIKYEDSSRHLSLPLTRRIHRSLGANFACII